MNAIIALLAAALVSVSLSLVVLRILSDPLAKVLDRVCQDACAAAFWLSYTRLMLTIAPLLVALAAQMFSRFDDPLDAFRLILMASLGGLLFGLHMVGTRLVQFIRMPSSRSAA